MKFAPIFNPEACKDPPPPVRVDLRKVFLIGIALWVVATAVFAVLIAVGFNLLPYLRICIAGIVVGVAMLIWEFFDRPNYRKLGE